MTLTLETLNMSTEDAYLCNVIGRLNPYVLNSLNLVSSYGLDEILVLVQIYTDKVLL